MGGYGRAGEGSVVESIKILKIDPGRYGHVNVSVVALLQPARSVCVSLSAFFIFVIMQSTDKHKTSCTLRQTISSKLRLVYTTLGYR